MRSLRVTQIALLLCLTCFAATMTNDDVLRMVKSGASAAAIVAAINGSEPGFVLEESNVRSLRRDGVPEVVIQAMFARNSGDRMQLPASPPATPQSPTTPRPTPEPGPSSRPSTERSIILTNASIIDIIQEKLSSTFILLAISECTPRFSFDSASLLALESSGVPVEIVKAMMAKQNEGSVPTTTAVATSPMAENEP